MCRITPSDANRKMQSSIAAAETVGNNEDLVKQLLVRLPAQSLIRFKSVSKQWLSIISNPNFRDSHTLQNPNPKFSSDFFWSRTGTKGPHFISHDRSSKSPLNFIPDPQGIKILQSCNGLLLCRSSIHSPTTPRKFYVVNPTTSQCFQLPLPPKSKSARVLSVALAFDPSKSLHYKVVCILGTATFPLIEIEIYSSQTRSWRVCGSNAMWFPSSRIFLPGVYCNGSINWLSPICWLVHYDIDAGHYGMVNEFHGDNCSVEKNCICFGVSCGNLHLIQVKSSVLNQFDVLEMARDYSGWSVKYRVDLNLKIYAGYYPFLFLHVEENEEKNPSLLVYTPCKVISYNLRDKTFKKLFDLDSTSQVEWRDAFHCMETLACV